MSTSNENQELARMELLKKYPVLGLSLGRIIPIKDLAKILNIDIRVLRCNFWRYGGIPGGAKKIIFYERTVENALLGFNKERMDRTDQAEWEEAEEEGLCNEAGSADMGNPSKKRYAKSADTYGLLS